ncbi:DUF2897 family protein [Thalassotalea ganghwensis]
MLIIKVVIILLAIGLIAGAVLLLKQSAKKFKLDDEQLKRIKQRNLELEREETKEDLNDDLKDDKQSKKESPEK